MEDESCRNCGNHNGYYCTLLIELDPLEEVDEYCFNYKYKRQLNITYDESEE